MNAKPHTLVAIDDAELARRIDAATHRVVFVAPALGIATAGALRLAADAGGSRGLTVDIILDANEDTFRIGYGDPEALGELLAAMNRPELSIRRQPGLRIGLLLVDDQMVIWSPTPRSIEGERASDQPNGVVLGGSAVADVEEAIVPDESSAAPSEAEIGTETLAREHVEATMNVLKENPPVPFDLARKARVFSSRFQFVEAEIRGAEWTERQVKLSSIILNPDLPDSLQEMLETRVRPFQSKTKAAFEVPLVVRGERAFKSDGSRIHVPLTQADIMKEWHDIRGRYLWSAKGFGWLIRCDRLKSFLAEVQAFEEMLKSWVVAFRTQVQADEEKVVEEIFSAVTARMGRATSKRSVPGPDALKRLIAEGLDRLRVIEPSVKVVVKNVSWESSRDAEFEAALREAVPASELEGWFQEFTAAPESKRDS